MKNWISARKARQQQREFEAELDSYWLVVRLGECSQSSSASRTTLTPGMATEHKG